MKLAYNTSSGTLNVSGTGFVNMPNNAILMDFNGAARATVELSGGTLLTTSVQQITASGTGTFDFNGGVLEPAAPTTTFLQGLTAANVQVGGTVINTLGNNITIAQNLVHDPSLGTATDGGLTKLGNGMLTLSATVNTFNGPTTVNGGTLQLSGGAGTDLEDSTLNTNGTGTVHFTGVSAGTLGGISGNGVTKLVVDNPLALTVGANNSSTTFSGSLGPTVVASLTKSGAGTLILSGTDTYSGGTFVTAGTLIEASAYALPRDRTLTVGAGGTLIFDPTQASGSPVSFDAATGTVATVPEPGTLLLLAIAACGAGLYQRARSRQKK